METYKPIAGTKIRDMCQTLEQMVAECGESVTTEFNGVMIVAEVGMTAGDLEQGWRTETDRRWKEYEESPKGKENKRVAEDARRRAAESAKKGIVTFDISDEAAWRKWRTSNDDGGYGECCLRYAARWARLMDIKIADGMKLEDIADPLSHEADTEGITGFMYGCAVSMLSQCWRHGEALRWWHNLKTQCGDEGRRQTNPVGC